MKKKRMNRLIAAVFSCLLAAALMPAFSSAEEPETYPVWVGSIQVTSANMDDILQDGGKAKYDPDTKTLEFNDPAIPEREEAVYSMIYAEQDLIIKGPVTANAGSGNGYDSGITVLGDLTLIGPVTASSGTSHAIVADGDVIISGGSVTATTTGTSYGGYSLRGDGIHAGGDVEISGSLTVEATSYGVSTYDGDIAISGAASIRSYNVALYTSSEKSVTVGSAAGAVELRSEILNAVRTGAMTTSGEEVSITADDAAAINAGTFTMKGGDVTISAPDDRGIEADSLFELDGGTLGISSRSTCIDSSKVLITDGDLIAESEDWEGINAYDYSSDTGECDIRGGSVTVRSGGDSGIKAKALTISGGVVTATGTGSSYHGIDAGSLSIENGITKVTATGIGGTAVHAEDASKGSKVVITEPEGGRIVQLTADGGPFFTVTGPSGETAAETAVFEPGKSLRLHFSSVEGEDLMDPVETAVPVGTTVEAALAQIDKTTDDTFFEKEGYRQMLLTSGPITEYGTMAEAEAGAAEGTLVIGDDTDLYALMFKEIGSAEVTVAAPACGGETSVPDGEDAASSQTDPPALTVPADDHYTAAARGGTLPAIWVEEGGEGPYIGTFAGGNDYFIATRLAADFGYCFAFDEAAVSGGEFVTGGLAEADTCYDLIAKVACEHEYGEWTKLDSNQHQKVCAGDPSHVIKEDHTWDAGRVTKEPTEKETGTKTYTCTVCNGTKTETIAKLKPSAPKVSGILLAKLKYKGKTGMTITWNKVSGVKGYDVYFGVCNDKNGIDGMKMVRTVKAGKTLKVTRTGLRKNKSYKAIVKAYVIKDGKKSYVRTSPTVHEYTSGGIRNHTNAKSVTVKKASVSLKKGKTYQIKAGVTKVQKGKKLMPTGHAAKLRYYSSNKKVATVSKAGKITAKAKGSCKVYVIAVNGAKKTVKITVK